MVNKKKSNTQVNDFKFKRSDWLLVPLVALAGIAVYNFVVTVQFAHSLVQPVVALLVTLFAVLFIYMALTRRYISRYAKVAAQIFSWVLILSLVWVLFGAGQQCAGFFGVRESCMDTHYLQVWILLFNPYSLILWGALALAGSVFLLVKTKKQTY